MAESELLSDIRFLLPLAAELREILQNEYSSDLSQDDVVRVRRILSRIPEPCKEIEGVREVFEGDVSKPMDERPFPGFDFAAAAQRSRRSDKKG